MGYFAQEDNPNNDMTALDYIWEAYPSMTNAEVRNALAKCGLTTDHITSQMRVLSGGENAKVRLCKLMQEKYNVLVWMNRLIIWISMLRKNWREHCVNLREPLFSLVMNQNSMKVGSPIFGI